VAHIVYLKSRALPILRISMQIRVGEFYFSFTPPGEECDVYAGLCLQEARSGWSSRRRSTRIINLEQSEDALLRACSKSNRYKIDRAGRRDNAQPAFLGRSDKRGLLEFAQYYDSLAATKDVPPLRRDQFTAMAGAGKLVISTARNEDGRLPARARLLPGAESSPPNAFGIDVPTGRRLGRTQSASEGSTGSCTGMTCIRFRESGVKTYDMGGWYTGRRDQALLRINTFKEEFGGRVVHEWDIFRPGSARGWLYLRGRDLVTVADVA